IVLMHLTSIYVSISHSLYTAYHLYTLFFLTYTPPTEIYTLSLHDALPIFAWEITPIAVKAGKEEKFIEIDEQPFKANLDLDELLDRKSTRLNSSHGSISYAVFCLKKKKKNT